MVVHLGVLDAVAVPIALFVSDESKVALVVEMRARTLLYPGCVGEVETIVALCSWAPPLIDLLPPKYTSAFFALAWSSWTPILVVNVRAVSLEDRPEVDPDNDPVDGGRGRGLSAEHREDGGVLPRLGNQAKNADWCVVELVRFPCETLVDGVEQGVGVALGLEVLHTDDDTAVVTNVVVIVTFQHLGDQS